MANSDNSRLYKYFTINQNFYNSIINNELYFSNPRNFNDPFDSNPRFSLTSEKENVRELFFRVKEIINNHAPEIKEFKDFNKLQQTCELLIQEPTGTLIFDYFNEVETKNLERRLTEILIFYNFKDVFEKTFIINSEKLQLKIFQDLVFLLIDYKKYGISCGSTTPTCPVMWGHYANNHQGVCIEFNLCDLNNIQNLCLSSDELVDISEVTYSNEPLSIFDNENFSLKSFTYNLLNTKSLKWNYEKEIRLINKNQGLLKFKKECLTKVIFGCKTNAKDRYSICRLLANLGYNFEFLIAKMQPDSYEMKIEPMTLSDIAGSGVHLSELNIEYPDFIKNSM
ncbi:DUF2971 domain-containing protein [Labilibaculum sp.]|uniref:DUF2971 domain-containing protein n=1 Tax=Labilibaculum sp. TaxID=2060723 RepID=UPI002AA68A2A|nr:DUF2971 domain-containing protein [Labilibaculum sp.]MBN2779121.1 DUF2971 domain-containing protein [Bacteroidales bacterium]